MQIGDILSFKSGNDVWDAKLIAFWDNAFGNHYLKFEWIEGPYDGDPFDILASDLQENSF